MPRYPPITLPGISPYLIQQGNNRQTCFFSDEDHQFYLDWLNEYARDAGSPIHAYRLMTNHVHFLLTPKTTSEADEASGQCYMEGNHGLSLVD